MQIAEYMPILNLFCFYLFLLETDANYLASNIGLNVCVTCNECYCKCEEGESVSICWCDAFVSQVHKEQYFIMFAAYWHGKSVTRQCEVVNCYQKYEKIGVSDNKKRSDKVMAINNKNPAIAVTRRSYGVEWVAVQHCWRWLFQTWKLWRFACS